MVNPEDFEDKMIKWIEYKEAQKAAFRRMGSKRKKCFIYSIQGWKIKDIAEKLHLAENTVNKYIGDAYRIIREEIHRRLDGDQNDE